MTNPISSSPLQLLFQLQALQNAGVDPSRPDLGRVTHGVDVMMRGHRGESVKGLQAALNAAGARPPLDTDGIFGPKTEAALKQFQATAAAQGIMPGLQADGVFGTNTLIALQRFGMLNPGAQDDYRRMMGESTARRAPMVGEERPAGTVSAGQLAREAEARRSRPGGTIDGPGAPRGPTTPGGDVQLNVPWYSQFDGAHVPGAGSTACYRAARAMAKAYGVNVPAGTGNRIQVATGEDRNGRVSVSSSGVQRARSYIDQQLDQGKPVVVGVSHKDANYNQDGITDHFVLVTGRGTDAQGRTFYTYHDPATTNRDKGTNNRFYVDGNTGNLVHQGSLASGYVRDRHTEMSMVVPNQ